MNEIIARLARELEEWKQANSPDVFVGPPDRHAQGWIEATSKHRNPILRIKTEAEKRHKMLAESKTDRLEEKLQHDIWDKQLRAIISISDHFYFEGASSSVSRSQLWDVVRGGKEQCPVAVDARDAPAPVAGAQDVPGAARNNTKMPRPSNKEMDKQDALAVAAEYWEVNPELRAKHVAEAILESRRVKWRCNPPALKTLRVWLGPHAPKTARKIGRPPGIPK